MTGFDFVISVLLVGLVVAQVWLTRKVWRSPSYDRNQKVLQSKLIWLLPVIGVVLVYSLMPDDDDDLGRPRNALRG